ncbi:hypothetical protein [Streptomyces iranensis]|uniref:Uncharacterized protein n=1 Tax=Streptomyces iranensis TaxID=576784 RepID=A0A060ZNE1_9ACTN|nr:hypothetical protein [Streptomyces iranensis]MBP2062419.1 hypothetical protein [Streptomyces iranensis]CDR07371.1 predicted protein [Streptomyces iranensis]
MTPGNGIVNRLADIMEAELIESAKADAARARALADDPAASGAELRTALRYLAHAVEDAAKVASLRAERLPDMDNEEDAASIKEATR